MSREIPLTRGLVAIVDDEDYPRLAKYRWHASGQPGWTYAVRRLGRKGKFVLMHRFIVLARHGEEVDHISGNRLDNRRANLRLAKHAQNAANVGIRSTNRSGFKGVSWDARCSRWQAHVMVKSRSVFLGRFADAREAARAYDQAATKHFGEFARTNESMGLL